MTSRSGAKDHPPHHNKWVTRNKYGILEVMLSDESTVTLVFTHDNPNVAPWKHACRVPSFKGNKT